MREYKSRKWGAHDTCAAALRNAIQSDMINVYFLNRVADHVDALESCIREMQQSIPGGQIAVPQEIADTLRAIALRYGVTMGDEA